jgi:organic radical activating enzyme
MNNLPFDRIQSEPGWVQVDWTMTNVCNYACEYCPTLTHDGSFGWPSLESVDYTTQQLQKHYNKRLEYILLGGELAIWKQFPDAVEIIKKNSPDGHIKFITNGIMPDDYWQRIGPALTSVVFSYHPTQVKNVEKFVDSINALDNECKSILVLAWPDVWDKIIKDRQYIIDNTKDFSSLELKIVDNRFHAIASAKVEYTPEQLEFINNNRIFFKHGKSMFKPSYTYNGADKMNKVDGKLMLDNQNTWRDWYCAIGIDKITLDPNGSIRRGSGCFAGGEDFGNWKTMTIKDLPRTGVICPYDTCWCLPDMMASKHNPNITDKFINI